MKIVAISLAYDEADVIGETVRNALGWVDQYVVNVNDCGPGDQTAAIAEEAGAVVIRSGPPGEFHEGIRQCTLEAAAEFSPDWIVRIDADEMYHHEPNPRATFERAHAGGAACVRALVAEFWLTLHDLRYGALLEDQTVSIQLRRRWYTIGFTAMIGWRHRGDLRYYSTREKQGRANVPLDSQLRSVAELGSAWLERPLQLHYNGRSLGQVARRIESRQRALWHFGKYAHSIIIDEAAAGLHYLGPDDCFDFRDNHRQIYEWYAHAEEMYRQRAGAFGWEV